MSSILKVDTIQNTGGTTGVSIDNNGVVNLSNTVMYDMYRLTTDVGSNGTLTDWEKPDNTLHTTVGDSMSVSSGIFTFPRTGVYRVNFHAVISTASADSLAAVQLEGTTDNSSYSILNYAREGGSSDLDYGTASGESIVNINDLTNRKIRLAANSVSIGTLINGNTSQNETTITFQWLAPAQS